MKRSFQSHVSSKKHKKLPTINQNSQKMEEHRSSEISNKQTEDTQKSSKQKGKQSLSSQEQEHQFPTNNTYSKQKECFSSSNINGCLNGEVSHSGVNPTNVFLETDDFVSSPVQKDCRFKPLNGLRFYSPKSAYNSVLLKSSLEAEDVFASTSISPRPAPCLLSNLPESKSTFGKIYRRLDNEDLNLPDESIISSTRHDVLDVPIENPLDVTIEEPLEFDVWIVDHNNLTADIRYIPLNFGVKVEVEEVELDIKESEGCNINEEFYVPSTSVETSVDHSDNSYFRLVDDKTKTIKPTENLKNLCGNSSSTSSYTAETSFNFNDIDDNNVLFEDLEIEIVNTCYSLDDKEPSTAVDKITILENTNNSMEPEKLSEYSVASSGIETLPTSNNQKTNDSLFLTPSSSRYTRGSILRSRLLEVKNNDDNELPVSLDDSNISTNSKDNVEPKQLASGIIEAMSPVSSNDKKNDAFVLIPNSCSYTRNSTLRSRRLGAKKNENPKLEIGKQYYSFDGKETSEHLDASTSIERISLTSKCDIKDTSLGLMPSSNRLTRKLRSGIKKNEDLEAKIVNMCCSSDDNETSVTSSDTTSPSNTDKNIETEQLSQSSLPSNSIKRTSLALEESPLFQTPHSNMYARKSTLRSGSSGINKNEDLDLQILNICCSISDNDESVSFNDITSSSKTKESLEPEQLSVSFVASNNIKRNSLAFEDNHLFQTPSSNMHTRKSTLRSRNSRIHQNEDLNGKIVNTCRSGDDNDTSLALDNMTSPSNTNDSIKSKPFVTSNCSKRRSLALKDDSLFQTPSSNTHRKSTLRSGIKKNEDPEVKIVNICSGDDIDRSDSLDHIISSNNINKSIELEQKYYDKDDSLFLTPTSSNRTKKSTLRSTGLGVKKSDGIEVAIFNNFSFLKSDSSKGVNKSIVRSKSLEVKKSHSGDDLQRQVSSRSLSHIDQEDCFPQDNSSLEKTLNLKNKYESDISIPDNEKSESKKLMTKKILKVVVVPMENVDRKCHDEIQQIQIGPSSNLGNHKTTENNNLVEPQLLLNGMKRNVQTSKVEQNCDTGITDTQNPELASTDETFVNDDILNTKVNQSPSRKINQKKIDDKTSSDFISPRLKAKQLQQMGLIAEDTSFAFYSAVDSVLAEIKVSQRQHKLNSQDKKQHTDEDERIKESSHTPNVTKETKEQTVSVEIPNVNNAITHRATQVLAISSSYQNEDTRVTRNKKSTRKSRPLIQNQDSSQRVNRDYINTQGTFGKLEEYNQKLYKNNDNVLLQNGIVHLNNDKTNLDILNNELAELDDIEVTTKNEQEAAGNISLEILNEPEDVEESNADCTIHNKMADKHQDSECNIEIQKNNAENMSPTKRRSRSKQTETIFVKKLNEENTSIKQPLSHESKTLQESSIAKIDYFSPTRRKGRTRKSEVSFKGTSENTILSNEQELSQGSEVHSNTEVAENISIRRGRGRPRKSGVFTVGLFNGGDGTKHSQQSRLSSETSGIIDKVSTKSRGNNCEILPVGLSNDITVLKKQDLSQEPEVTTETLKKRATLSTENIIPTKRRGRPRKSEVMTVCESNDGKKQCIPKQLQECNINTDTLKDNSVLPAKNKLTVNKKGRTSDASEKEKDQILVTNEQLLYKKPEINNEVPKVGVKSAIIRGSPEPKMTRSRRSQELAQTNDAKSQLPPQESQLSTEIERNLNSHEQKSIQKSKTEFLPFKRKSSDSRKSESLTENVESVGFNISYSLEDRLVSPQQSETPKQRRGRSKISESTLITCSSELEFRNTANLNISQNDNDLNSSAGVAADLLNEKPSRVGTNSMILEQNNKQISPIGHEESLDSNMDCENKSKSVEKWVDEHVELVETLNKSIWHNNDSGKALVTNDQQVSKEKFQAEKEWTPRRSLIRGQKLVAMTQNNVKKVSTIEAIKDGDTRNSDHEKAVQNIKSVANTVEATREFVKSNAQIEEKSNLNRRLTRGNTSMLEQQKLMEDNAPDNNPNKQLENAQLIDKTEERCDTVIENDGKETKARSSNNAEENIDGKRRMSRRRSCSVLPEREISKEDSFEDMIGHRRCDSTCEDGRQLGANTEGNEKMIQCSPEKHRRSATSLGNRKKGKKSRSMSWSSRRSRCRSRCPSGSDMSSYKYGDLIWAQIGSYPYWPCMVTYAPGTKEIRKTYNMGRGLRTAYHVQFFGDNGRRAWINVTRTMPFNSSNDLKAMVDRLVAEEGGYNMFYQPFMFKSNRELVNKRLQMAAVEADSIKSKTIEEKLKFFEDVLNKVIEDRASSTSQISSIRSGKSKRMSEDLNTLPPSKIAKGTEKSTIKSRRSMRIESMEEPNETMKDEEEETVADRDKKDTAITPRLARPALVIPPLEELYSIEAQKALFKRNNLFKGVSRDKVCHFCLEPGDVLRCSAKCSGIYHLECSKLVMNNKIGGKRQVSLKYSPSINSEDGERFESGDVDDYHVQIVTVPSCIYNTPPRKNFPPDFDNLTLAEQIDYKMKEVMRKFESKNIYANDSLSASSDDNGSDKKVVIRHVAADSVIEEHVTKMKKSCKNNVAVRLFARPEEGNQNNGFKTPNSSSAKRYVAADEISFEALATDSKNFKCGFCLTDVEPNCFVCHERVSPRGSEVRQKCSLYHCGRCFHPGCLKMWPQTQWSIIQLSKSKNVSDSFVCPQHVCHTCVSDDPRAATSRCSCDKIVKCMLCPRSYHSSNLCIPAGTKILSTSQIICPGHRKRSNNLCINTTWCFLCSEGGNLICCENCPTSVHPECLPVNLTDDGKFICEDCESGRLPLYDEIVWVKLGHFRWWPAVILFPNEVPPNVKMVKHSTGDFVVRFFGTYNYYWVNRGRSFLFEDGDTGDGNNKVKKLDKEFKKAVEEATLAHKLKQEFKNTQQVESPNSQKPPPYIKIKVNKPVGNVRQLDLDLSNTTACNCDPNQVNPCGPDSDCLNRLLMTECNPDVCPAGSRCRNQSFEKREYPLMLPYKTQARGWGLKTLMPIMKGQFVIEYVGEIIDTEEYQRRLQKMHEQKEENYYFLTIDNQRMLDAGPKGNLARFMNHCCQPNCETQKWTVNGETRVGLFATMDIPAETELTFNYNLECVGKEKKVCRCGAPNCSGFIGVKAKQEDLAKPTKVAKRVYRKKKKLAKPVVSQPCFVCNRTGNVISCNNKICNKAYHTKCLKLDINQFDANRFVCPWHNCDICSKRTIRCCVKCIRSYCPQHSDGKIRHDSTAGFVCYKHDPIKRSSIRTKNIDLAKGQHSQSPTRNRKVNKLPLNPNESMKRKKAKLNPTPPQYKEALIDVSTTDSDSDTPLAHRLKKISKNRKNHASPKQTIVNEGIAGMSSNVDGEIPLAQTLSSAIKISKTLQTHIFQDDDPNESMKRTKSKLNPTPLQYKEALLDVSTSDSDSDTPLAHRLKKISKNRKNHASPKQIIVNKGIAGMSSNVDDEIPLAQTLSSAIKISKRFQPQIFQDEVSKIGAVSGGSENASANAGYSSLIEGRDGQQCSGKTGMEEHLAISGSEIEICNSTVTTTNDEMEELLKRKTSEMKDTTSHDPESVPTKSSVEDSPDEAHETENKKRHTKTKAQLKEYPTNIETKHSREIAAFLAHGISEQNMHLQDDKALTDDYDGQTLAENSATQRHSSGQNAVDTSFSKVVESGSLDDSICDGSPIQDHGDQLETNLGKSNDAIDTSRLSVECTERENGISDKLSENNENSVSEINADVRDKLLSDNFMTDDSQDECEKPEIHKRRKRIGPRLTIRKRRR